MKILILILTSLIPRQEVIDSAFSNANVEWYADSINVAPVRQCRAWTSDYQAGHTYHGVAYEYGGWDDPQRFLNNLAQGIRAGAHSDNDCINWGGDPPWATGQDCSGLISIVWKLPYKHSTRMLPGITYPISYDSLKMGDAVNNPGHHVVLFYQWADSGHTRFYIFQATDRRPGPSTTGLDLAYVAGYRYSYTPIRYPYLTDSIPRDTLPRDTIPETMNLPEGVFVNTIRFIKPEGLTSLYIKLFSVTGQAVYRELYGTAPDSMVVNVTPDVPEGVYFLIIDNGRKVYLKKRLVYLRE